MAPGERNSCKDSGQCIHGYLLQSKAKQRTGDFSADLGAISHHWYCKTKFTLTQKWKTSGRNMGIFMKGLNEEWLKLPVLVRTWGETQLSQEGRQSFAFRTKY